MQTRIRRYALCVALGLAATAHPVLAQEAVIGYVKTAQDEASLVVDGKTVKAEAGMPVQVGYVLKTGKQGSLGVTLRDNTMMSIGPDTQLVVDEYLYAPGKGELRLAASLVKGTLQYISGVIAKLKPEAVTVKTPVGIIGVRGTRYVAYVEEVQP